MKKLQYLLIVFTLMFALLGVVKFVELSQGEKVLAAPLVATPAATEESEKIVPTPRAEEDLAGGLFISLTTDELDRAAMAINLATKVMNQTGKPATIFLNVEGVRIVDTHIPQPVHVGGKTLHEMLQMFMDDGGIVLVCPMCMKNVGGLTEDELLEGVIIGTPEYTWSAMFAEGVTVLSY